MARTVRRSGMKEVPLSEIKDIPAGQDRRAWTGDGCVSGMAREGKAGLTRWAPSGRRAHGERPQDVGGEPLRSKLGHSEPLYRRRLDPSVNRWLQPDADDAGAGLHDRRRDRESLPEESRAASLGPANHASRIMPVHLGERSAIDVIFGLMLANRVSEGGLSVPGVRSRRIGQAADKICSL
jgi:hypothetical protein